MRRIVVISCAAALAGFGLAHVASAIHSPPPDAAVDPSPRRVQDIQASAEDRLLRAGRGDRPR